jgi:hypothetical protein
MYLVICFCFLWRGFGIRIGSSNCHPNSDADPNSNENSNANPNNNAYQNSDKNTYQNTNPNAYTNTILLGIRLFPNKQS